MILTTELKQIILINNKLLEIAKTINTKDKVQIKKFILIENIKTILSILKKILKIILRKSIAMIIQEKILIKTSNFRSKVHEKLINMLKITFQMIFKNKIIDFV